MQEIVNTTLLKNIKGQKMIYFENSEFPLENRKPKGVYISREEIEEATKEYLKRGGKIKKEKTNLIEMRTSKKLDPLFCSCGCRIERNIPEGYFYWGMS
jgi:hypothetical protein